MALAGFGLAAGVGITAIGHAAPAKWLTLALGIALIALAPWLLLRG